MNVLPEREPPKSITCRAFELNTSIASICFSVFLNNYSLIPFLYSIELKLAATVGVPELEFAVILIKDFHPAYQN